MRMSTKRLRKFAAFVAFAALCICTNANAAQVRAWLDRGTMQLGETVTLNIEVTDNATAPQPDFSALQQDFNLLGTQSSTAVNLVNGQTTSKLLWAVGLEPKRAGTFTIPALSVAGAQTEPLSLVVQGGSSTSSSGKSGDDVFLSLEVEPKSPYVQQQVRMTVKLFYAVNLTDGNLEDPHGDGLNARKLGQDAPYEANVDGRRYRVLERHYALTAEKSGTLTMPAVVFHGHSINPSDLNSFFNRGRSVVAQTPATTLDVRPRPANSGSDAWLPARSVTLTADGMDLGAGARVGEPVTLTLRLKAQGLGFEQLPELKLPRIDGADIYPDKEATQNRDDGTWLYGERVRKFAIVPSRPGALTIPPLSVSWWNTEHDVAASTDLAAVTLNVQPALAAAPAANAQNAANAANAENGTNVIAPASPLNLGGGASAQLRNWQILATAAIGLWVATLFAWLMTRRRRAGQAPVAAVPGNLSDATTRTARKAFADACANDDASVAAHAVLAWARAEGATARSLGDLARALGDDAQRAALGDLDRARYGAGTISGANLAAAFRDGLKFVSAQSPKIAATLPPLYPFDLRKDTQDSAATLH